MAIHTKSLAVVPDMKLSPNVGSDRSWVWNAAADVSEGEPEAQTLAIRFANSESEYMPTDAWVSMLIRILQTPTLSRSLSSRPSKRTRRFSERASSSRHARSRLGQDGIRKKEQHARMTALALWDGLHDGGKARSIPCTY
jgi:hypothetical protein